MEIVLAKLEDLNQIQEMYSKIVENMYENGIKIWNTYYPNEVFEEDIENNNLYLLKENKDIIGAFAMYEHSNPEEDVAWEDKNVKAYLLNRVGVNVNYLHQGVGQKLISGACEIAKEKGAKFLRLLVSDVNVPAINLYLKCKFNKVNGIHEEKIGTDFSINEYGFEIWLK